MPEFQLPSQMLSVTLTTSVSLVELKVNLVAIPIIPEAALMV